MDFVTAMRDPKKLPIWVQEHQTSVQIWSGFGLALALVILFVSDRDFSFLLTFSSMVSMMSFAMMCFKIETNRSVVGVSSRMIACYLSLLTARCYSIIFWEGYLPWDSTGDWMYQFCEGVQLLCCAFIYYRCVNSHKSTAADSDTDVLNPLFLIAPSALLACLIHPSLNNNITGDIAWAFAMYLEALSGLPQLVLFHKEGKVEPFTSHFLIAQTISKISTLMFWLSTHHELSGTNRSLPGYWVIIMQGIQIVIMFDFIYQYVRCLSKGVPVQFMLNAENQL